MSVGPELMHLQRWHVSILIDYPGSSVTDMFPVEHPGIRRLVSKATEELGRD